MNEVHGKPPIIAVASPILDQRILRGSSVAKVKKKKSLSQLGLLTPHWNRRRAEAILGHTDSISGIQRCWVQPYVKQLGPTKRSQKSQKQDCTFTKEFKVSPIRTGSVCNLKVRTHLVLCANHQCDRFYCLMLYHGYNPTRRGFTFPCFIIPKANTLSPSLLRVSQVIL